MNMKEFIRGIPKAENHVHLTGCLAPELAIKIAKRNNIELGSSKFPWNSVESLKQAYNFTNLKSFLDLFAAVSAVLCHKKDFYDLATLYCENAYRNNIRHAELYFGSQLYTSRGISFNTVVNGINQALSDARKKYNLSVSLILNLEKDKPVGSERQTADCNSGFNNINGATAWRTFKQCLQYNAELAREKNKIIGIGLASQEIGYPPELFKEIFETARENGFFLTSHAGEEGPPEIIWDSIKILKCLRIDHGVKASKDKKLLEFLATKQTSKEIKKAYQTKYHKIPLTICPLSNYKLKVFSDPKETNILTLLDSGVLCTVNSDDPAYFGGNLTDNYLALIKWLSKNNKHSRRINIADIKQLCINGFEASLLPIAVKDKYIKEVECYFSKYVDHIEKKFGTKNHQCSLAVKVKT